MQEIFHCIECGKSKLWMEMHEKGLCKNCWAYFDTEETKWWGKGGQLEQIIEFCSDWRLRREIAEEIGKEINHLWHSLKRLELEGRLEKKRLESDRRYCIYRAI